LIWGILLLPSSADFVNGYATDGHGCRVVGIVDGDTIGLHCPGKIGIVSGRILGFDTPEIFSPRCLSETVRGVVAKWDLRLALWHADTIGVGRRGHDRYGRELVLVSVDGQDIATRMIGAGVARPYGGGRRQGWCA
jgi:endonuclease YncB( thermonuclease family)